jgi:hypothetical protein
MIALALTASALSRKTLSTQDRPQEKTFLRSQALFNLNWYCMWPSMPLERLFFHTTLGVAAWLSPAFKKGL